MADAKVQIGNSADFLEGTSVDTPAGSNLFREGVVISDPEVAAARAKILNAEPVGTEYGLAVRQVGIVEVAEEVSSGATTVSVAATTTPFTILAANANRKGATFYNTSATAKLYVTLGASVSLTLFTIILDPNGYYEVPFNYVGLVSAVFDSATGGANVTELT